MRRSCGTLSLGMGRCPGRKVRFYRASVITRLPLYPLVWLTYIHHTRLFLLHDECDIHATWTTRRSGTRDSGEENTLAKFIGARRWAKKKGRLTAERIAILERCSSSLSASLVQHPYTPKYSVPWKKASSVIFIPTATFKAWALSPAIV